MLSVVSKARTRLPRALLWARTVADIMMLSRPLLAGPAHSGRFKINDNAPEAQSFAAILTSSNLCWTLLAICVTPRISRASWAARSRELHQLRSEWQPKHDGVDARRDDGLSS